MCDGLMRCAPRPRCDPSWYVQPVPRALAAVLIALLAGSITASSAGAGPRASSALAARSVTVSLALPGPSGAELVALKLYTGGPVSSVSIRGLNEARLPPRLHAIAVVTPPHTGLTNQVFDVMFAVDNGGLSTAARAATTDVVVEEVQPKGKPGQVSVQRYALSELRCKAAVAFGNAVDLAYRSGLAAGAQKYLIVGLRPKRVQPRNDEAILDYAIANQCPSTPGVETPDRGLS